MLVVRRWARSAVHLIRESLWNTRSVRIEFEVGVVHTHGVSALPQSGPMDETVTASLGWETGPQRAADVATHPRPSPSGGGGRSRLRAEPDRRHGRPAGLPGGARRRAGGGAPGSRRLWCRQRASGGRRARRRHARSIEVAEGHRPGSLVDPISVGQPEIRGRDDRIPGTDKDDLRRVRRHNQARVGTRPGPAGARYRRRKREAMRAMTRA